MLSCLYVPLTSSQEGLSKLLSPTSSSTTSFLAAEQIVARSFAPSSGQDGRKKKHKKKRAVETKRRARARPASPIHIHVHNAESTSSGAVSPVVGASRTPCARAVLLAISDPQPFGQDLRCRRRRLTRRLARSIAKLCRSHYHASCSATGNRTHCWRHLPAAQSAARLWSVTVCRRRRRLGNFAERCGRLWRRRMHGSFLRRSVPRRSRRPLWVLMCLRSFACPVPACST